MRHCDLHHENYLHVCFGCLHDQIVADLTAVGFTVLSLAELRARDEAIIEATLCLYLGTSPYRASRGNIDAIIASTKQETPT